jgi:hypothetical protein
MVKTKLPLQRQIHILEALYAVRASTSRVLYTSMVAMVGRRQGTTRKSPREGCKKGGRAKECNLQGKVFRARPGNLTVQTRKTGQGIGTLVLYVKRQQKLVYDDEQQFRSKDSKDGRCEGSSLPICQNGHQNFRKHSFAVKTVENWNSLLDSIKAEVRQETFKQRLKQLRA